MHRAPEPLLEIRIALTNDEWSIRAPLEAAFTALPAGAAQRPLRDEDGGELGAPAQDGWSLQLEEDYGRRRAEFVERVGDINAPISADHVYMYIHQTGMRRDDDLELEWQREREIIKIEQMWEGEPEIPPDHPDHPGQSRAASVEPPPGSEVARESSCPHARSEHQSAEQRLPGLRTDDAVLDEPGENLTASASRCPSTSGRSCHR